jgi:hypothetical protein
MHAVFDAIARQLHGNQGIGRNQTEYSAKSGPLSLHQHIDAGNVPVFEAKLLHSPEYHGKVDAPNHNIEPQYRYLWSTAAHLVPAPSTHRLDIQIRREPADDHENTSR